MPFKCARAVCLTFCYSIRWALTPVFGPSFVNECLKPDDPGYGRWKINPQLVLEAAQEVKDRKTTSPGRSHSPADSKMLQEIPRSMPANIIAGKDLRPRKEKKPSFPSSSPFASDSDASYNHHYSHKAPAPRSPSLSPKSSHRDVDGTGWTSINHGQRKASISSPRAEGKSLASALLTEPRYSPTISWRDAEPLSKTKVETVVDCADPAVIERHDDSSHDDASHVSAEDADNDYTIQPSKSSSGSESDDVDISTSPPMKRRSSTRSSITQRGNKPVATAPRKFNATDARAAHWLLNLSARDSELAASSNSICGLKRKYDLM